MTIRRHSVLAAAAAAVMALTTMSFTPAEARPQARHHYSHGHANRAALGAFLGVMGTIATLAARDRYHDRYYGRPGPYAYGYGPYAPPPAYGWQGYREW